MTVQVTISSIVKYIKLLVDKLMRFFLQGGRYLLSLLQNEMRDKVTGLFSILFYTCVHTCLLSKKISFEKK
jgi:hypothetical protein